MINYFVTYLFLKGTHYIESNIFSTSLPFSPSGMTRYQLTISHGQDTLHHLAISPSWCGHRQIELESGLLKRKLGNPIPWWCARDIILLEI